MSPRRAPLYALALALALAAAAPVSAHPLQEGTARITLRDNHIDVTAEWDLFALVDASPTTVATCEASALAVIHATLRRRIESETLLRVDGAAAALMLTEGPDAAELRAIAAQLSAAGQDHGARVRVRLEAPRAVVGARHVSLRAPSALGPVVVSFVQPATRYTRPGGEAGFEVLERARPMPRPVEAPREAPWSIAVMLTALLAGAAGYVASRGARVVEAS